MLQEDCKDMFDEMACDIAVGFCEAEIYVPLSKMGMFFVILYYLAVYIGSLTLFRKDATSMISQNLVLKKKWMPIIASIPYRMPFLHSLL